MSTDTGILLAILIPLGLILMGYGGYMYDRMNKNRLFENKYKEDIFDGHRKVNNLIIFAPISFLTLAIKSKQLKDIIIGIVFFILLLGTLVLVILINSGL